MGEASAYRWNQAYISKLKRLWMKASAYKTIMWWWVHIDEDKFNYSLCADAPSSQKKFWFFFVRVGGVCTQSSTISEGKWGEGEDV